MIVLKYKSKSDDYYYFFFINMVILYSYALILEKIGGRRLLELHQNQVRHLSKNNQIK